MTALEDVAAERRRQIGVEGWSEEHDDTHSNREMAIAAACYASAPPDDQGRARVDSTG